MDVMKKTESEMRLIDANSLKDDLRESYNALKKIYNGLEYNEERAICGGQLSTFLEAILRVKEAPTVDAVGVVRCRECKKHCEYNGKHYCKFWRMYCPDDSDFFCKAGERKEGADNG